MLNSKVVKLALKQVIDPGLEISIVDIGLIYKVEDINQNSEFRVIMTMTPTNSGRPFKGYLIDKIKKKVSKEARVDENGVKVKMVFDPLWTPEAMSQKAKASLGFN